MPSDKKSILDNKAVSVIVALAIIAAASILIYYRVCNILNDIKNPKSTGIPLFINFNEVEKMALFALGTVILLVVIIDKEIPKKVLRKKNNMNLGKVKDNIIIGSELIQWKDDIFQMCKRLHIKSVHVCINDSVQDIAEATRQKQGIDLIQISRYYFADMYQYFDEYLFKKVIMFIIGHELAHIYFNDRSKGQTAAIRIAIFCEYMFCLRQTAMLMYRYDLMRSVIFLVWAVSAIYFLLFVVSVIIDARYWGQIKELRADRVGMEVSNTSPNVFDAFASYCQHNLNGDSNEKDNIIYFFYKQYVELEDHPSLKRRSIELHRNKRWGITEHIRYCWMIRWKSWKCRGWKL